MTSEPTNPPCPSLEELAAWIDGRLPAEDRARVAAHAADCPDCYTVVAGVIDFLEHDEAAADTASHPHLSLVRPLKSEDELPPTESVLPVKAAAIARTSLDWPWMLRLAAAVVVGVGAGVLVYSMWKVSEPDTSAAELVAGTGLHKGTTPIWPVLRSGSGSPYSGDLAAVVRLGASVTDLQLWAREGKPEVLKALADNLPLDLKAAFGPDQPPTFDAKAFAAAVEAPARAELEKKAAELDARVEEELLESGASAEYKLGRWLEAGRLAAASGNTSHFAKSSTSSGYLRWLSRTLESSEDLYVPIETVESIRSIEALLEASSFNPGNFLELEQAFQRALRAYDESPVSIN